MLRRVPLLAGIVLAATACPVEAQVRIGTAETIRNSVTGTLSGHSAKIGRGDRVYQNQVIETASDAQARLRFIDKTVFSVGADAKVTLDSFVFDPATRRGKVVVNAAKGAFRFVSGIGRKKNYTIKTPTASIGIRGTTFHLFVLSTGTTAIALIKGALRVCNAAGSECRIMTKPGRVMFVLISGRISREMGWGERYMLPIDFHRAFPFIRDTRPFQGNPTGGDTRIDHQGNGGQDGPPAPAPSTSGGGDDDVD